MADDFDVEELLEAAYNKPDHEGHIGNHDNGEAAEADDRPPSDEVDDDDDERRSRRKKKKHRRDSKSRSRSRSPRRRRRSRSRSKEHRRRRSRSRDRRRSKSHERHRSRSRDRRGSRDHRRYRSRSRDKYRRSRSRDRERRGSRGRRPSPFKRSPSPFGKPARFSPPMDGAPGMFGGIKRGRSPDPEPPSEDKDRRTVMCMQLAAKVGRDELIDFFKSAGKVREAHVIADRQSRRSKGIAYVEFESETSVTPALQLSGQKLCGIPIIIQVTQAEKNRLAAAAENLKKAEGPRKLYVGSLHYNINEQMLKAIFEPFGQVEHVLIARDPETGRSKQYAFIEFKDSDVAERAKANLNGLELAGQAIVVNYVTEKDYVNIDSLDNEDKDVGVGMTPQSRAALMAKLAEGHNAGLTVPKIQVPPVPVVSACFAIHNMFDPASETGPNWDQEIREDVLEECMKFGNVLHIQVDKFSQGTVYVKCQTPQTAQMAMQTFSGRFYAGKQITTQILPESTYHHKYPGALAATQPLRV